MKILLLNQTFYPDVASTAQHLTDLAVDLAERGHEVTVVTGRRAYEDLNTRFPARENWRGVRIYRVFSTAFGKGAKWRRAADFASFILSCCARLATLPRSDVVVALTTPPLISFIGAWYARLRRARFCYWVMDFNPDEAVAAGWLRAGSLAGRLLDRMSRFSLRRANRIIALDRFMRDRIVAKGIPPEKVAVLPPWSHDSEVRFDAAGRERFRKAHGLEDKFVVMYSGNHSPVHPLDTLLEAARRLQNDKDVVFCFVGGGSEWRKIERLSGIQHRTSNSGAHQPSPLNSQPGNILCLPYQPLNQLSASLSAADVHVVVMGNAFVGLVHPCKLYNVLRVAAPILYIGPRPSHISEILEALEDGHPAATAAHGDVEAAVQKILQLRELASGAHRRVSPGSVSAFSKEALVPRLVAELTGG